MNGREVPKPTELVYAPRPSWAPALTGAGLAVVGIGLFAGWVYAAVGGVIALAALRAWVRQVGDEVSRLPRQQRLSTAVLPAVPLRGPDDES